MTPRTITLLSLTAALLLGVTAGCESTNKFTRQRYETIYTGQESYEVEATLGEPYHKFSNSWTYMHDRPFYKAVIGFDQDGTVASKAWYDSEEMGDHPESLDVGGPVTIESGGNSHVTIDD